MKTKRTLLLTCAAALSLTTTVASAAMHASPMMTRPAPRFAPRTLTGTHHFRRFDNRTFISFDTFGFLVFYPYPYYGYYYPYDYYGSNAYGDRVTSTVAEAQRRLARAGYYHGLIDGILGPQTRRAIQAYARDHNTSAYGVIDRQLLRVIALG
jgi:putative peptidoglycan binding protein